jgi:hypothetical protein
MLSSQGRCFTRAITSWIDFSEDPEAVTISSGDDAYRLGRTVRGAGGQYTTGIAKIPPAWSARATAENQYTTRT